MTNSWESDLNEVLLYQPFPEVFDSHAHFLDEHFDEDRDMIISDLHRFHVSGVMEAACRTEDLSKIIALCRRYPDLFIGAAGIHPEHAYEYTPENMALVREALSDPCMHAVGEIGLDYHYDDNPPRDIQRACFEEHLALASLFQKPALIHDRDAHGDCLDILRSCAGSFSGVMHCFSGSWETARECLDLGLYIGIGGSSTFKNAKKINEIIPKLPLDRILLETDCPYMAPEPFRGHRNDSRYMQLSLEHIVSLRPESREEIAEKLLENTRRFFSL